MSSLLDRMLGRSKDTSAQTAKQRLQFVLVHDRINLPPDRLKAMKEEILAVISKYVAVQGDEIDIALEQRERGSRLVAEVPFSKSIEPQRDADLDDDDEKKDDA